MEALPELGAACSAHHSGWFEPSKERRMMMTKRRQAVAGSFFESNLLPLFLPQSNLLPLSIKRRGKGMHARAEIIESRAMKLQTG